MFIILYIILCIWTINAVVLLVKRQPWVLAQNLPYMFSRPGWCPRSSRLTGNAHLTTFLFISISVFIHKCRLEKSQTQVQPANRQHNMVIWCCTNFRKSLVYEPTHTLNLFLTHTLSQTEGNVNSLLSSVISDRSRWMCSLQSATAYVWTALTCMPTQTRTLSHTRTYTVTFTALIKAWELWKVIWLGPNKRSVFLG